MKHLTYFFFSLLSVDSLLIFPRVCLPHPLLSGLPDVPTQAYPHFTCPCSWVKPDWHWVYLHGPSLHPRTCLWVILWAALVLRRMSWGCPTWCPPETMVASPLFCWWSPCAWFLLCLILRLELPHELLVLSPLGNPSPLVRMGRFLTLKLPFLPSDHTLPQIKAIGIFFDFSMFYLYDKNHVYSPGNIWLHPRPMPPPLFWIMMRKCQARWALGPWLTCWPPAATLAVSPSVWQRGDSQPGLTPPSHSRKLPCLTKQIQR